MKVFVSVWIFNFSIPCRYHCKLLLDTIQGLGRCFCYKMAWLLHYLIKLLWYFNTYIQVWKSFQFFKIGFFVQDKQRSVEILDEPYFHYFECRISKRGEANFTQMILVQFRTIQLLHEAYMLLEYYVVQSVELELVYAMFRGK